MKKWGLAMASVFLALAGCVPPESQQTVAEPKRQAPPRAPLPTDFLGIELGKALLIKKCDGDVMAEDYYPCVLPYGRVNVSPSAVPTGLETALSVTVRNDLVEEIWATIERGNDGRIVGNLVDKYGPADRSDNKGHLEWMDGKTVVVYDKATDFDEGSIWILTSGALAAFNARTKEAQNRKL